MLLRSAVRPQEQQSPGNTFSSKLIQNSTTDNLKSNHFQQRPFSLSNNQSQSSTLSNLKSRLSPIQISMQVPQPALFTRAFGKFPSLHLSPNLEDNIEMRSTVSPSQTHPTNGVLSDVNSPPVRQLVGSSISTSEMSFVGPSPRYLWKPTEKALGSG